MEGRTNLILKHGRAHIVLSRCLPLLLVISSKSISLTRVRPSPCCLSFCRQNLYISNLVFSQPISFSPLRSFVLFNYSSWQAQEDNKKNNQGQPKIKIPNQPERKPRIKNHGNNSGQCHRCRQAGRRASNHALGQPRKITPALQTAHDGPQDHPAGLLHQLYLLDYCILRSVESRA